MTDALLLHSFDLHTRLRGARSVVIFLLYACVTLARTTESWEFANERTNLEVLFLCNFQKSNKLLSIKLLPGRKAVDEQTLPTATLTDWKCSYGKGCC